MRSLSWMPWPVFLLVSLGCGGTASSPAVSFDDHAPRVGADAPAFSLATLEGNAPVALADLCGSTPLVLVFGSYS